MRPLPWTSTSCRPWYALCAAVRPTPETSGRVSAALKRVVRLVAAHVHWCGGRAEPRRASVTEWRVVCRVGRAVGPPARRGSGEG